MADQPPEQSQQPQSQNPTSGANAQVPDTPAADQPIAGQPTAGQAADNPAAASGTEPGAATGPTEEALPDGTKPTVLTTGTKHSKTGPTVKGTLNAVYRRADITTTLLTFAGAAVAAGLIIGGYLYLNRNQNKPTFTPKVEKLDKADLDKLTAFFGGNSAGSSAEVLTISSPSFFKGRVALASDLKVVGGAQVSGPTALGDLTVDKVATLGVTNIRGQLTVAGPVTLQSPTTLAAGLTIGGSLTVTGNGSFGGSLSAGLFSVRDLTVTGTLSLSGHIAITGQTPSAAAASEAGSGAGASVDGNDSAGTVTINTGAVAPTVLSNGGLLGTITFRTPYAKVPRVIITAVGQNSGLLNYYVQKNTTSFTIGVTSNAKSNTSYSFDYWVVQ